MWWRTLREKGSVKQKRHPCSVWSVGLGCLQALQRHCAAFLFRTVSQTKPWLKPVRTVEGPEPSFWCSAWVGTLNTQMHSSDSWPCKEIFNSSLGFSFFFSPFFLFFSFSFFFLFYFFPFFFPFFSPLFQRLLGERKRKAPIIAVSLSRFQCWRELRRISGITLTPFLSRCLRASVLLTDTPSFWNGANSCHSLQRGQVFVGLLFLFSSKMYTAGFVSRNICHVMWILICLFCLCVLLQLLVLGWFFYIPLLFFRNNKRLLDSVLNYFLC